MSQQSQVELSNFFLIASLLNTLQYSPLCCGSKYPMVGEMHPAEKVYARGKCADGYFVGVEA